MSNAVAGAVTAVGQSGYPASRRFLWGGLGALLPILVTVAVADHLVIQKYVEWFVAGDAQSYRLIGYGIRVVGLFILGGLWASFHRSECEPLKLVQLGIVAPAIISGMISADNLDRSRGGESAWSLSLIGTAHAQEPPPAPEPAPSPLEQIIQGLLGRP